MDANGTRHHLLLGESDWQGVLLSSAAPDLGWDPERASVGLAPRLPRVERNLAQALEEEVRRGAAVDRFGTWYWIDQEPTRIRVAPNADDDAGTFWSTSDLRQQATGLGTDFSPQPAEVDPAPAALRGLAVTSHHYLVVGMLDPAGLLIFDLHAGGPPLRHCWPEELAFSPLDMAPAADGGVWILDRDDATGSARYWKLDRHFRIVDLGGGSIELEPEELSDFKPVGGEAELREAVTFPAGTELDASSPVDAEFPSAILELADGSVLILDNPPGGSFSLVHRFRDGSPVGQPVSLEQSLESILDPDSPAADPDLRAHDFAYLPPTAEAAPLPGDGALFFAAAAGSQSFAFALTLDGDELVLRVCPRYLPMRSFTGKALVSACGEVYYDYGEQWLQLTEHPRRRFESEGVLRNIVFDCGLPRCRWHRLMLDGCIPNGSAVRVRYRAADDRALLDPARWQEAPAPYLRATGSEQPFYRPLTERELERPGAGTWELLFQKAEGRLLELEITLASDGRSSPRLRALRAYAPRFSYLEEYLPAVYREDTESASFLDRFLANPEGLWTEIEDAIAAAQILFDTRTAPPEFLDWLAGWLGADLDPLWSDERRRQFLDHAPLLFRWRGTARGLLAAIRIATEPCPDASIFADLEAGGALSAATGPAFGSIRVLETYQARSLPSVVLGDPTDVEGPGLASVDDAWEPAMGATALHLRYGDYLRDRYRDPEAPDDEAAALGNLEAAWSVELPGFSAVRFSPVLPANPAAAADWSAFIAASLAFPYAVVTDADTDSYRQFLAERYSYVGSLNAAYRLTGGLEWSSFDAVTLPDEADMPESGPRLLDWIDFASLFLPIRRNAHRFTVLVPTEPSESLDARYQRLGAIREIVEREKPTHTSFDVKPYWALFQVGSARLALDTVLGEGSRFVAVVLGSTYLGESFLAESHPWNVADRSVLGRDTPMEI